MPPHWDSDAAWYDASRGQASERSGPPPALRLWLPVIVSFVVQVPAVALLAWPARALLRGMHDEAELGVDVGYPGLSLGGWVVAVGLATAGPVALVFARRFPGPVVAVTAAAAGALVLVRPDLGVPPVALAFAIMLGIVRGARVWVYTSVAVSWVATIALANVAGVSLHPLRVAASTLGFAMLMGAGEVIRSRREHVAQLRLTNAARRVDAEQRERVRIARELHDVLAHSLSQINVQAGVALHLIDAQPEKAAQALASIKITSKNALDEVRMVLGILRSGGEEGAAPLAPEPDLAGLPNLVESFRAQGLTVEVTNELEAELATDPPAAARQLALYRICQEALTNVLRHARAGAASVYLGRDEFGYVLTVRDDGHTVPPTEPILPNGGLLGMRERAELLGGTLRVQRLEQGGMLVEAHIPSGGPE
ncbi:sensor histidine kinase [Cryobacterium sp. MLB-32]|uniref:sensor histidine kinase n=1 Tax=Cryobacterium sp. MLB-32 TaxID=1529318 RepID=UPI00068BCBB2|nr:sensor histidine kinase [Cryobacterium sp. MLB-32]